MKGLVVGFSIVEKNRLWNIFNKELRTKILNPFMKRVNYALLMCPRVGVKHKQQLRLGCYNLGV